MIGTNMQRGRGSIHAQETISNRCLDGDQRSSASGRFPILIASLSALVLLGITWMPAIASASEPVPVAAYAFDEGSGEVAEDSTATHDATVHGAQWTEAGKYGPALEFDGENDRLTIPTSPELEFSEGFTLEAWVWPQESRQFGAILAKETPEFVSYALEAGGSTTGIPEGLISPEGHVEKSVTALGEIPVDTWSHIALTYDGEQMRLYVNGELIETAASAPPQNGEGQLQIGGTEALGDYFDGKIDEVQIYDDTLTEIEIDEDRHTPVEPATGSTSVAVVAEGSLVEGGGENIVTPSSILKVKASDVGAGIAQVSLLIDGQLEQTIDASEAVKEGAVRWCEGETCFFSYELTPAFSDPVSGSHTLSVRATDRAGYSTTEDYPVLFDSQPPELDLSGALAEADGSTLESETAKLAISASDGSGSYDSGVGEIVVRVDESVADVDNIPCSLGCPEPATYSYTYSEEEWGVGPHLVSVTAVDLSGNETIQSVRVNAEPIGVLADCTAGEQELISAGASVSVEGAEEALEESVPSALAPNSSAVSVESEWPIDPGLEVGTIGSPPTNVLQATDTAQGGYIETRAGGGATTAQAACLVPTLTTSAETSRQVTAGAPTAVSANSAHETDTAIRATAMGSTIIESFRGSAPEAVSWEVPLKSGEELVQLESGAVAIVSAEGSDQAPRELPAAVEEPNNPDTLNQVTLQEEAALYDAVSANNQVEGEVLAIAAKPAAINAKGEAAPASLSIGGEGALLVASVPSGSKALILRTEASVEPLAMCANAFSGNPSTYVAGCSPGFDSESSEETWIEGVTWSPSGQVLYSAYTPEGELPQEERLHIFAEDEAGDVSELAGDDFAYAEFPSASPDGKEIVFDGCTASYEDCGVFVMNSDGSDAHLVVAESVEGANFASFSADGARIYYFAAAELTPETLTRQLFSVKLDGTDQRQVTAIENDGITGDFGPAVETLDGKYIILGDAGTLIRLPGSAENAELSDATLIAPEPAATPAVSPDGEHILFISQKLIMQARINGEDAEQLASSGGNESGQWPQYPAYAPDGTELVYQLKGRLFKMSSEGGNSTLMAPSENTLTLAQAIGNSDPPTSLQLEAAETAANEASASSESVYEDALGVNRAERFFCEQNLEQFNECRLFYGDRNRAVDMRERLFTGHLDEFDQSTRGNAFQHGLWTTLMDKDSTGTHTVDGHVILDGLLYALIHEGERPFSWDAKMDILNDFTGNKYWLTEGNFPEQTQKEVCEALRIKGANAIFLGAHISPFKWSHSHAFQFKRLVFRKLRINNGSGMVVRPNGHTCNATW